MLRRSTETVLSVADGAVVVEYQRSKQSFAKMLHLHAECLCAQSLNSGVCWTAPDRQDLATNGNSFDVLLRFSHARREGVEIVEAPTEGGNTGPAGINSAHLTVLLNHKEGSGKGGQSTDRP